MNFCIGIINIILSGFMLYICMSYWHKSGLGMMKQIITRNAK